MNQNPEQIARDKIDQMLVDAGWLVQSKKEVNLSAGIGVALRETNTESGSADYILFVNSKAVGVIEAKAEDLGYKLLQVEEQSVRYSKDAIKIGKYTLESEKPFVYESTGTVTRFTDYRDPKPRGRNVFWFHKPETLAEWIKKGPSLRERLLSMPELDHTGHRPAQIVAVENLEQSFKNNRPKALIQMAPGAGKTFTAATFVYRLLKHVDAKRILFVVDTKNLGEQAEQEFMTFQPNDDNRKFTELNNVQRLNSSYIASDSQVCISTIQRLYSILKGEELDESAELDNPEESTWMQEQMKKKKAIPVDYTPKVPIEQFDFIVIDECHRSIYNLWKQVLDYFDASLIGLTATPDKRTFGFFNTGQYFTLGLPEPIGSTIERSAGLGGRAFTAHPHIDSNTGYLVGWGWKSRITAKAVEISLWEWDEDWREMGRRDYVMEGCEAAPHDFGVTEKWYVMIQNRLGIDPLPFLVGAKGAGECLISQPQEPLLVHLIPRSTQTPNVAKPVEPVIAEGPRESFEIHVALAHDGPPLSRGETTSEDLENWVTVYTAGWDKLSPGVFLGEWGSSDPWPFPVPTELSPDFNNIPRTLLWMYEINAVTGEVKRQPAPGCEDLCIDHPHVSPLFEGKRACRYVYASLSNEVRVSGPPLGYVRIDLKTGELQKWYASNRSFCEEPVIVPKANGANEDDAWLIGLIADHSRENPAGISRVVVLDCADIAAGPVCSIPLRNRIPHGLHGMFVGRE